MKMIDLKSISNTLDNSRYLYCEVLFRTLENSTICYFNNFIYDNRLVIR